MLKQMFIVRFKESQVGQLQAVIDKYAELERLISPTAVTATLKRRGPYLLKVDLAKNSAEVCILTQSTLMETAEYPIETFEDLLSNSSVKVISAVNEAVLVSQLRKLHNTKVTIDIESIQRLSSGKQLEKEICDLAKRNELQVVLSVNLERGVQ